MIQDTGLVQMHARRHFGIIGGDTQFQSQTAQSVEQRDQRNSLGLGGLGGLFVQNPHKTVKRVALEMRQKISGDLIRATCDHNAGLVELTLVKIKPDGAPHLSCMIRVRRQADQKGFGPSFPRCGKIKKGSVFVEQNGIDAQRRRVHIKSNGSVRRRARQRARS